MPFDPLAPLWRLFHVLHFFTWANVGMSICLIIWLIANKPPLATFLRIGTASFIMALFSSLPFLGVNIPLVESEKVIFAVFTYAISLPLIAAILGSNKPDALSTALPELVSAMLVQPCCLVALTYIDKKPPADGFVVLAFLLAAGALALLAFAHTKTESNSTEQKSDGSGFVPSAPGAFSTSVANSLPSNELASAPTLDAPQSTSDPRSGMALRIKRSKKDSMTGAPIYMIDARLDASAEIRSLIVHHRLGNRVIYESTERQKHAARAMGHIDESRDGTSIFAPASQQMMGVGRTFWKLGRAAVSSVRASLSLRITVDSLMSGVHVECKDMDELMDAEQAIREARENLAGQLALATSFDGREEVI